MLALRTTLLRTTRTTTPSTLRAFSMSGVRAAEGDTGAPRSGGAASSDSFTKREAANEDMYVKQQEKAKLEQLKKKIADSEAQLAQDRKDVEELSKKGGQ